MTLAGNINSRHNAAPPSDRSRTFRLARNTAPLSTRSATSTRSGYSPRTAPARKLKTPDQLRQRELPRFQNASRPGQLMLELNAPVQTRIAQLRMCSLSCKHHGTPQAHTASRTQETRRRSPDTPAAPPSPSRPHDHPACTNSQRGRATRSEAPGTVSPPHRQAACSTDDSSLAIHASIIPRTLDRRNHHYQRQARGEILTPPTTPPNANGSSTDRAHRHDNTPPHPARRPRLTLYEPSTRPTPTIASATAPTIDGRALRPQRDDREAPGDCVPNRFHCPSKECPCGSTAGDGIAKAKQLPAIRLVPPAGFEPAISCVKGSADVVTSRRQSCEMPAYDRFRSEGG